MQMRFGLLPSRFVHRTIVATLIAAALQATAAGQTPARDQPGALTVGERVDVTLRDCSHVRGRISARLRNGIHIEQSRGQPTTVRYLDVLSILDLDTGTTVAIPVSAMAPHDTRWVKPVLLVAAAVGFFYFTRITGCFGSCHY